jgi:putative tricarboxylic transport membrane protein
VPTLAFGVPTSAGMALLLGAFLIHGLVPGPDMLGKNLDITYSMVWSIAIANILGSGLCFLFSGQLARLCTLRYSLIMPVVLSLVYIGAFQGTQQWGDFYALLFLGAVGWIMKQCEWPRPPLVLGFVLGRVLERNLFLSIQLHGFAWLDRPVVLVMFALAALSLMRPLLQDVSSHGGVAGMVRRLERPRFRPRSLFPAGLLCLFAAMLIEASDWTIETKIIPLIVGSGAVLFGGLSLVNEVFVSPDDEGVAGFGERTKADLERRAGAETRRRIHMDIASSVAHLPSRIKLWRGGMFFAWLGGFMGVMAVIGLIPTVPLFIIGYMRLEGRERWRLVASMATVMTVLIYVVFDQLLVIPWPPTLIGGLFPALRVIPSV